MSKVDGRRKAIDDRLAEVLDLHFDPKWGAPFWVERAKQLPFDPRGEIQSIQSLRKLGAMPIETLARLSIEDFIPRAFHSRLHEFVISETGGTTGAPKRTAFLEEEFREAFVDPFVIAAESMNFPHDVHWLYIGPSGPHVIGKAARECAVAMGSVDPFTVDFDPRWVKKMADGSMARARYVEHILTQARQVLATQHIGVLFATPPILAALAEELDDEARERITGIHLGGLPADANFWKRLTSEWYPNAVAMSGYGNSLAGVCPQLNCGAGHLPEYFPHGPRLVLEVTAPRDAIRGQIVFHRLDRSCFLPNVFERDEAEPVECPGDLGALGFQAVGIRDPRPRPEEAAPAHEGLY